MIVFTGVLLNMDGQPDSSGEIFYPSAVVELPEKEVLVTIGFSRDLPDVVGTAKITKNEEGYLKYDMTITREEIPASVWKQLKPCLGGRILERVDSVIGKFTADSIGLAGQNADPRIKALGEE
jgi:hypothetical protein